MSKNICFLSLDTEKCFRSDIEIRTKITSALIAFKQLGACECVADRGLFLLLKLGLR